MVRNNRLSEGLASTVYADVVRDVIDEETIDLPSAHPQEAVTSPEPEEPMSPKVLKIGEVALTRSMIVGIIGR